MRPVLTPAEMGEADRRAIAAGIPEAVLVERAGHAVAWAVRSFLGGTYGRRVVVVCGKGNNGADGRVAGRVLRGWGVGVDLLDLSAELDRVAFDRELARGAVFVDAMYGTGFRGALDGDARWVAETAADRGAPTVAADIPSGVAGDTGRVDGVAVRADRTVCFAALKPGLLFEPGRTLAGRVQVADIGIDPGATACGVPEPGDLALPRRGTEDHKWSSSVLLVGGSPGMTGAVALAGRAAARVGAGMVVCGVPGRDAVASVAGHELVVRALPATPEGTLDTDAAPVALADLSRFRALAIGPGLGRSRPAARAVARLVAEAPVPVVVDADGLNALSDDRAPLRVRAAAGLPAAILTPHAAEYARLAGRPVGDDRVAAARALAADTGCVVLLKGPGTVVAEPSGRAAVNPSDGPALAAAGTGDVLTGIVAGLLALGVAPFAAALTGAYVQGAAATVAATGDSLVAGDLVAALPRTLEALRRGAHPVPED